MKKLDVNVKKRLASYCQCKYHTTPKWKIKKRLKLDKMKEHIGCLSSKWNLNVLELANVIYKTREHIKSLHSEKFLNDLESTKYVYAVKKIQKFKKIENVKFLPLTSYRHLLSFENSIKQNQVRNIFIDQMNYGIFQ